MSNCNLDHLDPTSEITLEVVKDRAVKGVVVLTGRTFILSVISLVATGLLTVFLSPEEFGVFWIVSAIVNFLSYFSDIGLAAALIQKKEKVLESDLRTTFTVQQILVVCVITLLVLASPILTKFYSLSDGGRMLLYALTFSFFLSSLKTIPSVLLERDLDFGKLVLPQILENLVYNVLAVFLAWKGFGVMSFAYAVVVRGVVGLIAIYVLKPWKPGLAFSKTSLKKLLTFGIPYQLNTFLATVKDDGMTVVLGGILGTGGIGLLGWAQKWGQAPLRFFMDHVVKVTFPAFSRLQNDKKSLEHSLERSLFFIGFLVFPSLFGLLALAPLLVEIIPRYDKWQPALIPLIFIGVNTLFASVTTQMTNVLNAIGKIKVTFKLMVMWSLLTWIFVPVLAMKFGIVGAAAGYAIVGSSSIIALVVVRKYVKYSLITSVFKPLISSFVMFTLLLVLRNVFPPGLTYFWILLIIGGLTYLFFSLILLGSSFKSDVKKSFEIIFSRK